MSVSLQGIDFEITGSLNSSTASSIRKVRKELEQLKDTMASGKLAKGYKSLSGLGDSSRKNETVSGDVTSGASSRSMKDLAASLASVKDRFMNATSGAGQFLASIKRIAMYRLIRTAIKEITEGLVEGTKNLYQFSKAGGDTGKFAATMDSLATSSLHLRNAVGSLAGQLITLLAPALEWLMNAAIGAFNAINQLIALLTGANSWNKALRYPKEFAEATGTAAQKAKDLKKTILGFDEINKLTKQSDTASGGGAAAMDYSKMFENTTKFSKWAEWVQEHLELIKGLALAIGVAFLGWKIGDLLGLGLTKTIGLMMTLSGLVLTVHGLFDAWNNGVNLDNLIESISGVTLMSAGLFLMLGKTAGAIGLLVGGVALLVVGLKDWITTGELSTETFWMLEAGIVAVSLGLAILTGSWIPLVVGAIVGLGLAIYKNWDSICEWTDNLIKDIKQGWNDLKKNTKETWENIKQNIKNAFDNSIQWIKDKWNSFKNWWKNLELPSFKIKMPHLSWTTEPARGWVSDVLSALGLPASLPKLNIAWYANGGFPEDGLFMANHGELVGKFANGKTAVANNEQIVEGIRQGVRDANSDEVRLLREQNELLRALLEKEGTVEIPLASITSAMQRKNQRDGGTFVPVG